MEGADEVFGEDNAVTEIVVKKKGSQKSSFIDPGQAQDNATSSKC